ncbi:MAG: hypothetical protein HY934_01740 [Candidatus Firestonebacteria bacterium]|nr:hypothetical protein [Candidatus Firestonebacteria bacterium]
MKKYGLKIIILLIFFIYTQKLHAFVNVSEDKILRNIIVKQIFAYKYKFIKIEKNGSIGDNSLYEEGKGTNWNVSFQQDLYIYIIKGIVDKDTDLIDKGIKAIEYGLSFQSKDGNFSSSSWYDSQQFISSSMYSLLLLKRSSLENQYQNKINSLIPRLLISFTWLRKKFQTEIFDLVSTSENFSSITISSTALCYKYSAILTNDISLSKEAENLIILLYEKQGNSGVLFEKKGYNIYYQSGTLLNLMIYNFNSDNYLVNEKISKILERGFHWLLSRIRPDGSINFLGNYQHDSSSSNNIKPYIYKTDYTDTALILAYWGILSNKQSIFPLSRKVFYYGIDNNKRFNGFFAE